MGPPDLDAQDADMIAEGTSIEISKVNYAYCGPNEGTKVIVPFFEYSFDFGDSPIRLFEKWSETLSKIMRTRKGLRIYHAKAVDVHQDDEGNEVPASLQSFSRWKNQREFGKAVLFTSEDLFASNFKSI